MEYDPIKFRLEKLLGNSIVLRRMFFFILDLLFLRAWYVRRELRRLRRNWSFGGDYCSHPPLSPPLLPKGGKFESFPPLLSKAGTDESLPPLLSKAGTDESSPHLLLNGDNNESLPPLLLKGGTKGGLLILDAGMGFGQYFHRLLRIFPQAVVVGLEINRSYFYGGEKFFQRRHPRARLVLGDAQRLPLENNRFHLITCIDVMEHILDDRAAFREFARILCPGGFFLMHTPRVPDDQEMREGEAFNPQDCQVGEHVREGYRNQEACVRLEAAGLTVERLINGYGAPGKLAWKLLQGVPTALWNRKYFGIPLTVLWMIIILPLALLIMGLDIITSNHRQGGSLLIVARKFTSSER